MLTNRTARILFGLFALVTIVVLLPGDAAADPRQWGVNAMPIRQGHHVEWQRASYRNSDGYVLVAWSDTRTGDRDIYAQLISPDGVQLWDSAGRPLAQVTQYRQEDPDVIAVTGGWIIFYFDRITPPRPDSPRVHPMRRKGLPLVGRFATRTPQRPNPIGLSPVELLAVRGNILRVRGLEALEGTPVLDIKPYIARGDVIENTRVGEWVKQYWVTQPPKPE